MSREIKFRAWDKKDKKFRGLNGISDLFSIRSDGEVNENFILEQYTGLKDKNGVEIYEGDEVKATVSQESFDIVRKLVEKRGKAVKEKKPTPQIDIVKYSRASFSFGYTYLNQYSSAELEVIGNIHTGVKDEI